MGFDSINSDPLRVRVVIHVDHQAKTNANTTELLLKSTLGFIPKIFLNNPIDIDSFNQQDHFAKFMVNAADKYELV